MHFQSEIVTLDKQLCLIFSSCMRLLHFSIMESLAKFYHRMMVVYSVLYSIGSLDVDVAVLLSATKSTHSGTRLLPALEIAIETISHRVEIGQYANFTLKMTYSPTGCSRPLKPSLGVAAQLFFQGKTSSYFGPSCSSNLIGVADFAAWANLPVFSGSASSSDLDKKTRFLTLTQNVYRASTLVSFLKRLFNLYGWKSFTLLTKGSLFEYTGEAIAEGLTQEGIKAYTILLKDKKHISNESSLNEASYRSRSKYDNVTF